MQIFYIEFKINSCSKVSKLVACNRAERFKCYPRILGGKSIYRRWANQSSPVSQQGSTWWSFLYGQAGLGIQVLV